MSDETTLLPCPFCKGEAVATKASQDNDGTWHPAACGCPECGVYFWGDASYGHNGFADPEDYDKSLRQAIGRWNTRTHGTLTAEQVREAIERHVEFYEGGDYDEQEIVDELNATLGSDTKPCYAADENYKRCKYSVNRGWCDDAPFLVWDDTGHLFITMGGLKTWDVTDDAKKWFAELGSGTCERVKVGTKPDGTPRYRCSVCEYGIGDTKWAHCPKCGSRIIETVDR